MNCLQLYRRRFVVIVAMLSVVTPGTQIAQAGSAQVSSATSPSLIEASAEVRSTDTVLVRGQDFTPGGHVYVAFYDLWGVQLFESRWVVASETIYGPNGAQDPAAGFSRGGRVEEIFGTPEAVYGPNGSQDPAYRPSLSETLDEGFGNLSEASVMVRAFDSQTATWSNVLDVDLGRHIGVSFAEST